MHDDRAWIHDGDAAGRLERGLAVEQEVAARLRAAGLRVDLRGHATTRPIGETSEAFVDECDLHVGGHRLEVKERTLRFTDVADFPFATVMVGRQGRWDSRTRTPCATVVVSAETGAAIAVPTSGRRLWVLEERVDRNSGRLERSYAAPRSACRDWHDLLEHLRRPCLFDEPPI